MAACYYSLNDFQLFANAPTQYSLPETVLQIIGNLERELNLATIPVGDQNTNRITDNRTRSGTTNSGQFSGGGGAKRRHISQNTVRRMDEKWETVAPIKPTVIQIAREGIDKLLSDLRNFLNKISTKTYDNLKTNIFNTIQEIMGNYGDENTPELESDVQKIVCFIFDTGCANKFYSELYAKLYGELIEKYSIFRDVIAPFIEKYIESIREVQFVDQNKDYDGFCENNKKNEKRRATSVFIMNLFINGILSSDVVVNIFTQFQTMAIEYIEDANKTNEVEEITENIFLMTSMGAGLLKMDPVWTSSIIPNIHRFAAFKMKEKPGLSSRAIFKYKDLVEKVLSKV